MWREGSSGTQAGDTLSSLILRPPSSSCTASGLSSSHFSCPVLIALVSLQQARTPPHPIPGPSPSSNSRLGRWVVQGEGVACTSIHSNTRKCSLLKCRRGCNRSWELGAALPRTRGDPHPTPPPPPPPRKETLPGCQEGDSRAPVEGSSLGLSLLKGQSSGRFQKLLGLMKWTSEAHLDL